MKTRYIHRFGLLLFLVLWLSSCTEEEEDYISKYCPGSCTQVSGTVLRSNGQPAANLQLSATWKNMVYMGGGIIRKKAVAYTDAQGNYTLRFLVRDEEVELGHIEIMPHGVTCSQSTCPSYYLYWDWDDEFKRDTTFVHDFVVD